MTTATEATATNATRGIELANLIATRLNDIAQGGEHLDWSHAGSTGKAVADLEELARFLGIAA